MAHARQFSAAGLPASHEDPELGSGEVDGPVSSGCPGAILRCWVYDSTAAGRREAQGIAFWIGTMRGFDGMEQVDGANVNRAMSGAVCSHARFQRLV